MDEHVWIPAILVNKRVPWSAHGQPALLRFRCTLREADSSQSPKSESGDQFLHGGRARRSLGCFDVFWIPGRRSRLGVQLDTSKRLQPSFCHLGYLGRQRLRMKERRGCDGRGQPPQWILRVKFWDGAWSSTVLRAKSSMTFSENRERLNPLVNHVYLILSAFQWPLGDESWLIHVNPSFSNAPHVWDQPIPAPSLGAHWGRRCSINGWKEGVTE